MVISSQNDELCLMGIRMRTIVALLMITSLVFASTSFGGERDFKTYRIASYYIPLLVEDSRTGAFVQLLQEAAMRAGIKYEIVMAPPKRAMRYFEDNEVDAIIPALRATLAKDSALTSPIFTKQIHAFVRAGSARPETIEDLEGMRIGLTRGFSFPRSITVNENIEIDYADTTDGSLKKLLEGRIDVVVADGYTALAAINKMNLTGFDYDLSVVLHEQAAYIACQPTEEGKALARKLSSALELMKADGTLDRILPKIQQVEKK